jgi:hypothetical protein
MSKDDDNTFSFADLSEQGKGVANLIKFMDHDH